jgi:cytoskeletal protein RodZ
VSIGETLAEGRRQAGLTVTQVSQRTRIRETIIRSIEQSDFSPCGGDFYARGHIRSIAAAIGIDPAPLIREYDAMHGAPEAIRAADVFEPSTPIRLRERRSPNWSLAMVLALLVVIGYAVYHVVSSSGSPRHMASAAHTVQVHPASHPSPKSAAPSPSHAATRRGDVVIQLNAVQDCWVLLTNAQGTQLYNGVVSAGSAKTWTEKHPVDLRLGNPGGVVLTVNGKKHSTATALPITLSIGPSQAVSG